MFVTVAFVKDPFVPASCHFAFFGEVPPGSVIKVEDSEFGSIRGEGSVEFPGSSIDFHVFDVRPVTPPLEEEPTGKIFIVYVGVYEGINFVLVFGAAKFHGEVVDARLMEARDEIVNELDIVFD
jgi:hypothetical protein